MNRDCGFESHGFRLKEFYVPLADRQRRQPSKLNRRVRFPQSTFDQSFGDRLTVGRLALNQAMEVRFLLPEFTCRVSVSRLRYLIAVTVCRL